jgi:hypothetical protein
MLSNDRDESSRDLMLNKNDEKRSFSGCDYIESWPIDGDKREMRLNNNSDEISSEREMRLNNNGDKRMPLGWSHGERIGTKSNGTHRFQPTK